MTLLQSREEGGLTHSPSKTPTIHIPKMLDDKLRDSGLRAEVRDSLALITWLVSCYADDEAFVPISVDHFGHYVRRNDFKNLKSKLLSWRIMECDGEYSARSLKKKSLGYRISPEAMIAESGYSLNSRSRQKAFLDASHKGWSEQRELPLPVHQKLRISLHSVEIDACRYRKLHPAQFRAISSIFHFL